ncbi:hypothetical protein LCGC14_2962330, partial [marine sediment metagenome]
TTLYREGEAGPMVIIPKGVELGELQKGLVLALLDVPSTLQTQELSQQLKQLAAQLDQIE